MPTSNLTLPQQSASNGQPHVIFNDAMRILDALAQITVLSRSQNAPPAVPNNGDRYIVGSAPSGAWAGHAGKLAAWQDGVWVFFMPADGWLVWIADEQTLVARSNETWSQQFVGTVNGGGVRLVAAEEELSLTGAFVGTTVARIQDRDIVLCVASRTIEAITGATAYEVGVAGETNKFGGSLSISQGATNIGVIGPTAYYAETPIRVTALGGNFTGGAVRLVLYAIRFAAPAS